MYHHIFLFLFSAVMRFRTFLCFLPNPTVRYLGERWTLPFLSNYKESIRCVYKMVILWLRPHGFLEVCIFSRLCWDAHWDATFRLGCLFGPC